MLCEGFPWADSESQSSAGLGCLPGERNVEKNGHHPPRLDRKSREEESRDGRTDRGCFSLKNQTISRKKVGLIKSGG